MSYGICHQHAGLNRCELYLEPSRDKADPRGEPAPRAKKNEAWRRIAGITLAVEESLTRKERRKGLRRLVRWIAKFVKREEQRATAFLELHPQRPLQLLTLDARAEDVSEWACTRTGAVSMMRLCERLGLSAGKLSQLTREIQNISAGELLDGLKLRRLRGIVLEQFRVAAQSIWGSPGSLSEQRSCGFSGTDTRRLEACATDELPADEMARRVAELMHAWDAQNRGGVEAPLFLRLNFESNAKLDRACINVFGKTLRQTLTGMAREIVEYYLCAEDYRLRELASGDDECGITARARELYHKSDEAPEEPFLDRWSYAKTFRTQWLTAMYGHFG